MAKQTKKIQFQKSETDSFLGDIRERMAKGLEGDKHNRESFTDCLKFINLEQWPEGIKKRREANSLPCMVIDRINPAISQVLGDQRQNRPSIKIRPAGVGSKPEIAEIREGLIRNIWAVSRGDIALDTASESQIQGGWGFIRVFTEYAADDVFEQNIKIGPVRNTLSVLFDPIAQEWDRMDGAWCIVFDKISKDTYKAKYGDDTGTTGVDAGDAQLMMWRGKDDDSITLAEYFQKEEETAKLFLIELIDQEGKKQTLTVDEAKKDELLAGVTSLYTVQDETGQYAQVNEADMAALLAQNPNLQVIAETPNAKVLKERSVKVSKIYRWLVDGYRILEDKALWPSQFWPIVPVDGKEIYIDGKVYRRGMVKNAMDAQRAYNYSISAQMTNIALANKIPKIMTPQMIEGHEDMWNRAHTDALPYLLVNEEGVKAAGGWPQSQSPPMVSSAYTEMAMQSAENVRITTEVHQAALGMPSNETSGIAINARKLESDVGNFIYGDNLARAVHRIGEIANELIPVIYDTERVITIMGEDETTQEITINEKPSPLSNEILNDLTVGKYKVAVDVGPSYTTQRIEAAESMLKIVSALPPVGMAMGDEIIRNMDFPGAQKMRDRIMASMVMQGQSAIFSEEELKELVGKFPALQQFLQPAQPPMDPNVMKYQAEAQDKQVRLQMDLELHELEKAQKVADIEKTKTEALKNVAQAEAAEAGSQISAYQQVLAGYGMELKREQMNKPQMGGGNGNQPRGGDMPQEEMEMRGGMEGQAIPGRAMGGPVEAGQPYLVGEQGPEVIVPQGDGMVIPTASLMPGGTPPVAAPFVTELPPPQIEITPEIAQQFKAEHGVDMNQLSPTDPRVIEFKRKYQFIDLGKGRI